MQEVYDTQWQNNHKTAVALGYFDGVHIGHKFLIDKMSEYALANNLDKAVFTFSKSITLGHKGKDILSKRQKLEVMQKMGIDLFYSPDFSVFSQLTPEEFVRDVLISSMGAKTVFCGENFLFGKNRAGNVAVLTEICSKYNVAVVIVPTVTLEGETVSSTCIREALSSGNIEKANAMLGRRYSIDFEVVHGKSLGKTLGTPTINQIYPDGMCTPQEGVYVTTVCLDGIDYPCATGFGTRPTVSGMGQSCETFIQGFSGDLYGKNIKVEFFKYLFPPRKFKNVGELKNMILSAADMANEYLARNQ